MAKNKTTVGGARLGGGFYSAPLSTALPTDAKTALNAEFKIVSLVSDDGLKEAMDRKSDDTRDWGGAIVRTTQSEYSETWKLTLLERTDAALKEIHGRDNVTITPDETGVGRAIKHTDDQLPLRSYVADMQDGAKLLRKVIPQGQITDIGDVKYVKKDVISYDITITAYKDENGVYTYDYDWEPTAA